MMKPMLSLRNVSVSVEGKRVLHGVSLRVRAGELHVLMGPNGSGKSTLVAAIAGNPRVTLESGTMRFLGGVQLSSKAPDERARLGIFVAFQQPLAIPGVSIPQFMKTALAERNARHLRPSQVRERLRLAAPQAGLPVSVIEREVNVGFSGGEQKRFELAQLFVLGAKLAVLDEIDSGLDVDGIRRVAAGIEALRTQGTGMLVVTHNPDMLSYLSPTAVHILVNGSIVKSGGPELKDDLKRSGFRAW